MQIVKIKTHGFTATGFWVAPNAVITTNHSISTLTTDTSSKLACRIDGSVLDFDINTGVPITLIRHPEHDIALIRFPYPVVSQILPVVNLLVPSAGDLKVTACGFPCNSQSLSHWEPETVSCSFTAQRSVNRYDLIGDGLDAGCSGGPLLYRDGEQDYAIGVIYKGGETAVKSMVISSWLFKSWLERNAEIVVPTMPAKQDPEVGDEAAAAATLGSVVNNISLENSGSIGNLNTGNQVVNIK